jgi:hypothetical protein
LSSSLISATHATAVVSKPRRMIRYADRLTSADSLAWSFEARRAAPVLGCRHANCANCLRYAAAWRERTLARLGVMQMQLRPAM